MSLIEKQSFFSFLTLKCTQEHTVVSTRFRLWMAKLHLESWLMKTSKTDDLFSSMTTHMLYSHLLTLSLSQHNHLQTAGADTHQLNYPHQRYLCT